MDSSPPIPSDIKDLSFEEALSQLEQIVRYLEAGESKLDETIKNYERGTALRRHCESKLRDAQTKIEQMTLTSEETTSNESETIETMD